MLCFPTKTNNVSHEYCLIISGFSLFVCFVYVAPNENFISWFLFLCSECVYLIISFLGLCLLHIFLMSVCIILLCGSCLLHFIRDGYNRNGDLKPMDAEQFREHAHKMVDFIADYYKTIENFPVLSQVQVFAISISLRTLVSLNLY